MHLKLAFVACVAALGPAFAQGIGGAPQLQKDFLNVIDGARTMYQRGETDLQKGASRPTRARALCALLEPRRRRAEKWVGIVELLTTNNEGKGVISIDVGQKTFVMTYNNAFSDMGENTMLDPQGKLFAVAATLKKGDPVMFSGSFLSSDKDCLLEVRLSMRTLLDLQVHRSRKAIVGDTCRIKCQAESSSPMYVHHPLPPQ
jgi:hypothetical protein